MEKEKRSHKAHCIVLPYPSQGHINPMLQFSKRLVNKGAKVTLAITHFISKSLVGDSGPIAVETISDGYDAGGYAQADSGAAYLDRFQVVGSETLTSLIEKLKSSDCPVDCIVYDAFLPWVLDVAKKSGLVGAVFFTQSCTVNNIYYQVQRGILKLPLSELTEVLVPGISFPIQASDLPSFVHLYGSYPAFFDMVVNQFSNIDKVDLMFCNTFYELEDKVVDWMAKFCPVKTIGPTLPSAYLDKRLENDTDYGLNMLKPATAACIEWLDGKPDHSVVYASYGSLAKLEPEQMDELSSCLMNINAYFLMVVRESEQNKLPEKFKYETAEKGMVVPWCPQLAVLAHRAVGCFLSHGGWNSALEALSLGVPVVVAPLWTDQPTNAKLIEDVWGIGMRAPADEKGVVRREVLERCIREVMGGGDRSEEIRSNVMKWKNLAREAVDEGGSSDKCIDEFVAKLSVASD